MLQPDEITFIQANLKADPYQIGLAAQKISDLNRIKLINQIQARQKLKEKLPTWTANPHLFFPSSLSIEQSSSEITSEFKAKLLHGKIIDITGGMGVDVAAFAKIANKVVYIEKNEDLATITKYNHAKLGFTNIEHVQGDGISYLKASQELFDFIYADPARRDKAGNKVLLFKDCEPNILEVLPFVKMGTQLLIKTSPLLDLDRAIQELQGVEKIWVVCHQNEVKELLFLKSTKSTFNPPIEIIGLAKETKIIFNGTLADEKAASIEINPIQKYLYEPHAGVLKAGFFKSMGTLGLQKLHVNTHLYSSNHLLEYFPGRIFNVLATGSYTSKWILETIKNRQVNIKTRNFPDSPETIRKKFKLKDGGNQTLFAYRNHENNLSLAYVEKAGSGL